MSPFLILLVGMVVVIGCVLVLRLHAFLALILGSLVVAALTSRQSVFEYELADQSFEIVQIDPERAEAVIEAGSNQGVEVGSILEAARYSKEEDGPVRVARLRVRALDETTGAAEAAILETQTGVDLRAGDRVSHPFHVVEAFEAAHSTVGERIASGFGATCLKIGILIAMAAIIGKCLLDSGAAEKIVSSLTERFGERRAPVSFVVSGFTLGIPVFFDTVFYLLIPLGKAMRIKTGKNYLLYILTIVAGGTMAHSLVPPTPGPLFVAGEMGVNLGAMILGGIVVGSFAVTVGYLYAHWANRRWDIPLRDPVDVASAEWVKPPSQLPPLPLALAPIVLPVLFIGGGTFFDVVTQNSGSSFVAALRSITEVLGNKNIALILSAAIALMMLKRYGPSDSTDLSRSVQQALASGGVIILITAGGGAFGETLRQTGIADALQHAVPVTQIGLIPLAFAITLIIRVAQGSATVAMITGAGIVGPLAGATELAFHPVYLALAIGCGSKPFMWMNDSGFWLMTKMTGMTEGETLKTITAMMSIMGFVGLLFVMLLAWVFPLAG